MCGSELRVSDRDFKKVLNPSGGGRAGSTVLGEFSCSTLDAPLLLPV